jgi:hypothetical protein
MELPGTAVHGDKRRSHFWHWFWHGGALGDFLQTSRREQEQRTTYERASLCHSQEYRGKAAASF